MNSSHKRRGAWRWLEMDWRRSSGDDCTRRTTIGADWKVDWQNCKQLKCRWNRRKGNKSPECICQWLCVRSSASLVRLVAMPRWLASPTTKRMWTSMEMTRLSIAFCAREVGANTGTTSITCGATIWCSMEASFNSCYSLRNDIIESSFWRRKRTIQWFPIEISSLRWSFSLLFSSRKYQNIPSKMFSICFNKLLFN